jgi:hypothetical protein
MEMLGVVCVVRADIGVGVCLGSSPWTHTHTVNARYEIMKWSLCPDGVLASPNLDVRFA